MVPLQQPTSINSLPSEIILKIFEETGSDIKNIKLRQVSKRWKALMDEVFKKLFKAYEKSPILKSIAKDVKRIKHENDFQNVKAFYLAIKAHIKELQVMDPSIKNTTLSVFDLERLEKIYRAPNYVKVFE